MNEIKVLVFCNNPIAIPSIRELLFYKKIVGVCVTKRNKEMQHILKPLLQEAGVPLFIISKNDFITQITDAIKVSQPTVGMLITFPFIIPNEILSLPPKGFINFHFGLLPQCRGPQPILWHMILQHEHAGVTVHIMDKDIDTGPVICQEKLAIEENDTYGVLQTKLAYLGAKQMVSLLKILSYGSIIPALAQDETKANYYEMPTAKDLTIDWGSMDSKQIVRLINACNPWNKGAGTTVNDWVIGIVAACIEPKSTNIEIPSGTIITCNETEGLLIKSKDNKLLKILIVYTNEGFFTGNKLKDFGIKEGDLFV